MIYCPPCDLSPSGGSFYKTYLEEIRLNNIFESSFFFSEYGGYGSESNWSSLEIFINSLKVFPVEIVESLIIDSDVEKYFFEYRNICDIFSDRMIISENLKKSVCYPRCSSRFFRDFWEYISRKWKFESFTVVFQDLRNICYFVKIKLQYIPKTIPEWSWESWESCGRSYECKGFYRELNTLSTCSAPYHDIYLIILHGSIENLLYLWTKTMNLINEEDISLFEIWENTHEIRLLIYCWSWRSSQMCIHLMR